MNILLSIVLFTGMALPAATGNALHRHNEPAAELSSPPEVALHLKGALVSGNNIKIEYQIPYPGYIEFYLYTKSGEKLWYNAYVKDKGDHFLAFKREKLEPGTSYKFTFWYKGKEYPGTFLNN